MKQYKQPSTRTLRLQSEPLMSVSLNNTVVETEEYTRQAQPPAHRGFGKGLWEDLD